MEEFSFLWNPKVQFCVYNSLSLALISIFNFCKTDINIILLSMTKSSKWHFIQIFRPQLHVSHFSHACQSLFLIWPPLTLILLTWRIWWAPNNASRWQMGFNSAFKGLINILWRIKITQLTSPCFTTTFAFYSYSTFLSDTSQITFTYHLL
jgi:hypothetical protein